MRRTLLTPWGLASAIGVATAVVVWVTLTNMGGDPGDAWDYFVNPASPYNAGNGHDYLYSPAFAQALAPLMALGFGAFVAFFRALELAAAVWFAAPVLPLAILLSPVASEINAGNINLLLMAMIALGFRWPALWSIVLLTKPTMGIGLLWFVLRREWRALAIALGATAAIAAVSFAINPKAWSDYAELMLTVNKSGGPPFPWPVWQRLPIALPLVVWGALTGRRWAVALGALIAVPRLYFPSISMLLGLLPLLGRPSQRVARVFAAQTALAAAAGRALRGGMPNRLRQG